MSTRGGPPRVFISYSHDSSTHVDAVRELSDRLREDGIDCHIDQYEMSPPEGWPQWMFNQIERSDVVLVVATETYNMRVIGQEQPGRGHGAKWEGAIITQTLYDGEGQNHKFIPVLLRPTDHGHIPWFLRRSTYYDLTRHTGYEDLYRQLTSQPRVEKPPLGVLRDLPPDRGPGTQRAPEGNRQVQEPTGHTDLVLLLDARGNSQVLPYDTVVLDDELVITVKPSTAQASGFIAGLREQATQPVGVAFGNTAILVRTHSIQQQHRREGESWRIVMTPVEADYGVGPLEMATTEFSSDQLAELRARRILLDETLSQIVGGPPGDPNSRLLEVLVRGQSTPIKIEKSPLPELYGNIGSNEAFFVAVARLILVLWLRLGGVTETISRLDLELQGSSLSIDFEGFRPRRYVNSDPVVIRVAGTCRLA